VTELNRVYGTHTYNLTVSLDTTTLPTTLLILLKSRACERVAFYAAELSLLSGIDDYPLRVAGDPSQRSPSWRTKLQTDLSQDQMVLFGYDCAGASRCQCMVWNLSH
jgi:hypothetical protein